MRNDLARCAIVTPAPVTLMHKQTLQAENEDLALVLGAMHRVYPARADFE